jgi:hypothetical protein
MELPSSDEEGWRSERWGSAERSMGRTIPAPNPQHAPYPLASAGGPYVPALFAGMWAPLPMGRSLPIVFGVTLAPLAPRAHTTRPTASGRIQVAGYSPLKTMGES